MSEHGNLERVWDIIESVGVCMLTTQAGGPLRARPIGPRPDRKSGLIFVVTDVRSTKQEEIEAKPEVNLVCIDAKAKAYLSIAARACVTRDICKIEQVWRLTDAVWWPGGASDSNVCRCGSRRTWANCGMGRRARRWLFSNSRSLHLARTAR